MSEKTQKKDEYQKALAAFGQAMKVFHKGDTDKAAAELKAFIEKYPVERELVDRAQMYLAISQKRTKKEIIHLKTYEDHLNYGVYKINSGDYEGALKLLEKALEFDVDEAKIHYLMADVYCLMNQPEGCLEHLKRAVQKDNFYAVLAQNEQDFESLRDDKKFKLITRLA